MAISEDAQLGLEEVVIDDQDAVTMLQEFFDLAEKAKPFTSARRKKRIALLERIKDHLDGEGTLRLGPYTIEVKKRESKEITWPEGIKISIKRGPKAGESVEG